jgi:hypothetical protein
MDENGEVTKVGELTHPSTTLKLGHDIARLATAKSCMAIKVRDKEMREEGMDFLHLMRAEWPLKVTKMARMALMRNQKAKLLPYPDDLRKLALNLMEGLKCVDYTQFDWETRRKIVFLVQPYLLLYNKRRPGELDLMT